MSKTLKIYLKDFPKLTGDTVGVLTEYDGGILEFSCNKNESLHWFKKHNGWGFNDAILKDLEARGCTVVTVKSYPEHAKPITKKWQVSFADLLANATPPMAYGGYEMQRFLPKNFWKIKDLTTNKVTDAKPARVKAVRKPAARKATVRKIAYNEDTKCGSCGVTPSELAPPGIFCTECRHIKSVEIHENYQKWKKEHGLPTETREEELARIQNENTLDEARKQKLLVGAGADKA